MSYKEDQILSLSGVSFQDKSVQEIRSIYQKVLDQGMHGLCFSAYEEGQEPGDELSEEQIQRRMEIIAPYTNWVRSFSCIEGNEHIPKIAHQLGINTLVGAWLGDEESKNEREIESLIELANNGYVDIAAVGNEVMYREDLTEEELLTYIYRVKEELPHLPVGYVDAYYEFTNRPAITEACDVILTNCYPFWEGCHIDYSLVYMKQMFYQALHAAGGLKNVIITETGWPSSGSHFKASHPSKINFMKYFINTQQWSKQEDIPIFYFTSFDESWKVGDEGDVGAYWGIWDKQEQLKF